VEFHLAAWLFTLAFGCLGYMLSALIRQRENAIITGIALSILVVTLAPQLHLVLSQNYARSQQARIEAAGTMDILASDPTARALRVLGLLPGQAFFQVLEFLPDLHREEGTGRCATCGSAEAARSAVSEGFAALASMSAVCLAVGAVGFARTESVEG
jgi:hypothetical protein